MREKEVERELKEGREGGGRERGEGTLADCTLESPS